MAAHAREHLGRAAVHAFVEGRREQREIEIRALARAAATAALAADCFRRRNAVVLGIVVSRVSSVGHVVACPRDGGQRATPPRVVPHPAAAAATARRAAAPSDARAAASTASRRVARNARGDSRVDLRAFRKRVDSRVRRLLRRCTRSSGIARHGGGSRVDLGGAHSRLSPPGGEGLRRCGEE